MAEDVVVIFLYSGVHGGLDYDLSGASQSVCAHGWGKRGGDITSSVVLAVIFNHTESILLVCVSLFLQFGRWILSYF